MAWRSGHEEAAVAVAEETELVVEGVAVAFFPGIAYECGDQQEQGAFGLVEIGDEAVDDVVSVAGCYHQLGVAVQMVGVVPLHPVKYVAVGFGGGDVEAFEAVGVPLVYVHGVETGVLAKLHSEPIDRLDGAHGGGADGDDGMADMGKDVLDVLPRDFDLLDVHFVFADGVGVDGFEGAGTDMEGDEVGGNAAGFEAVEHFGGEVKSGSGCGHRALVQSIDGLVAFVVATFGFAVEVGRQGDDAGVFDELGKGETAIPGEVHYPGIADGLATGGREDDLLVIDAEGAGQDAVFPLFVVADETGPGAPFPLLEGLRHGHLVGLKAEDLDGGACRFAEKEPRMDDLGVIKDEQCVRRQKVGNVAEQAFGYDALAIDEEFGLVAPVKRELGYAVVGQWIVVVGNGDGLGVSHGQGVCVGR